MRRPSPSLLSLRRMALRALPVVAVAGMLVPSLVAGHAQAAGPSSQWRGNQGRLTEFDAPGSSNNFSSVCSAAFFYVIGCGTTPLDNNDWGVVVGTYTDASLVQHGFLRTPDGHFIAFEAPGAGSGPGQGTVAFSINDEGVIAGAFQDSNDVYHGFLRFPDGSFKQIDVPGAGTAAGQGTFPTNVNPEGATAGTYIDSSNTNHGFIWTPGRWGSSGMFATFDPPGSVYTYPCEETCLAPDGAVDGFFSNASGDYYGFVRSPSGHITIVQGPNSLTTLAASINPRGVICGYYVAQANVAVAYVRSRDGSLMPFEDPAADANPTSTFDGTAAFSINAFGATTGEYLDANTSTHGFERFADGRFANFDAPDAGTGAFQGTRPSTNNVWGEVAGWYIDSNNVDHGFVWWP